MAGKSHLGIIDSEKRHMLRFRDKAEEQLAETIKWAQIEEANNVWVPNEESVAHVTAEMQVGTPMHYTEFEKKLKMLPCGPNLIFREVSVRPFRCVYYRHPDNTETMISPYGRTFLPEFSTMTLKEEIVRDFSLRHIDRKDMPKMKFNPKMGRIGGYEPVDPGAMLPGWTKTQKYWGENADDPMSRGYRTVLLRLVPKFATPTDIEKIFGPSNKRSWAVGMGHQNLPYKF